MRQVLAIVTIALVARGATAQEGPITELYGRGVHAYFAGRLSLALDYLNAAVDNGTKDPRVYYFRGLVAPGQGCGGFGADNDFVTAAALEMEDSDHYFAVGKALERIQGRRRQIIEQYRLKARLAAYQQSQGTRQNHVEEIQRAKPRVTVPVPSEEEFPADQVPEESTSPADAHAEPEMSEPAEEEAVEQSDPFAEPAEAPMEEPAEAPADEPADPFEEPAAPEAEPIEPATDEPAAPADEPPARR